MKVIRHRPGRRNYPPIVIPQAAPVAPQEKPKKKALLIGICYENEECDDPNANLVLKGPHQDVLDMKKVLIELYSYDSRDVTVLIDANDSDQLQPTRDNIIQEMKKLVDSARSGDQFFFHYAGHSTQKDTDDKTEEDGKDEFIICSDEETIKDDELRNLLVEPLPIGAKLISVFDSCHSASLLDLEHFRCNRIYVPWISKGRRRSVSIWNGIVRRQAADMFPRSTDMFSRRIYQGKRISPANFKWTRSSIDKIVQSPINSIPISVPTARKSSTPLSEAGTWYNFSSPSSPIVHCSSPEEMFCTGFCRPPPGGVKTSADVISLSAAKDGQRSWEDANGASMTQALIKILRNDPHPTLKSLLMTISHELHDFYVGMHRKARDYKKKMRARNSLARRRGKAPVRAQTVEMDNFQDPQLSSTVPLDVEQTIWDP